MPKVERGGKISDFLSPRYADLIPSKLPPSHPSSSSLEVAEALGSALSRLDAQDAALIRRAQALLSGDAEASTELLALSKSPLRVRAASVPRIRLPAQPLKRRPASAAMLSAPQKRAPPGASRECRGCEVPDARARVRAHLRRQKAESRQAAEQASAVQARAAASKERAASLQAKAVQRLQAAKASLKAKALAERRVAEAEEVTAAERRAHARRKAEEHRRQVASSLSKKLALEREERERMRAEEAAAKQQDALRAAEVARAAEAAARERVRRHKAREAAERERASAAELIEAASKIDPEEAGRRLEAAKAAQMTAAARSRAHKLGSEGGIGDASHPHRPTSRQWEMRHGPRSRVETAGSAGADHGGPRGQDTSSASWLHDDILTGTPPQSAQRRQGVARGARHAPEASPLAVGPDWKILDGPGMRTPPGPVAFEVSAEGPTAPPERRDAVTRGLLPLHPCQPKEECSSPGALTSIHWSVTGRDADGCGGELCCGAPLSVASGRPPDARTEGRAKREVWKRPPVPLDKLIAAEDAALLL